MTYAADTKVSIHKTKHEIQTLLAKHGAERFYCAEEPERAQVGFFLGPTLIKITLPFVAGHRKPAQHDQLSARVGARAERLLVDERRPRWKRMVG